MRSDVVEATVRHLRREAAIGAVPAAAEASDVIAAGYAAAADLIGAEVDEVAFVESGNRALAALIQSAALQPGDPAAALHRRDEPRRRGRIPPPKVPRGRIEAVDQRGSSQPS